MANQTHLRPNSRIVGYASALAVGLLALLFSWRIYVYTVLERDYVWVHFTGSGDLIGSLQEDDPVAIQGVGEGQVEDIQSVSDGVRVRLRFWKHQKMYRNAQATNVSNGLMGMRFVLLEPGDDTQPLLDRHADIPGQFRPGIAEVMSGIEDVVDRVRTMRGNTRLWVNGDSLRSPLPRQVIEKLEMVDKLLDKTDRMERQLHSAGHGMRGMAREALVATRSLDSAEPAALEGLRTADTMLIRAREMIVALHQSTLQADTTMQRVARTLEPFATDDSLLREIQTTLAVVDQVQAFVEGKTKLKTNFHLWGHTHSKPGE